MRYSSHIHLYLSFQKLPVTSLISASENNVLLLCFRLQPQNSRKNASFFFALQIKEQHGDRW